MKQENTRLLPAQFKPGDMGREKVDQEQGPDDVATRKPGNSQLRAGQSEEEEETFEIPIFRFIDSDVHLIQGPDKDKHHRRRQADDGELERGERL